MTARNAAHKLCEGIIPACVPVSDDGAWEHSRFCDVITAGLDAAVADERKRCLDWVQWHRENGEPDLRSVRGAIQSGTRVEDQEEL